MATLTLTTEQTAMINSRPGLYPYNVGEDSPLHGQTYRRFTYNGITFTAHSEDRFCSLFDSDQLHIATFEEGTHDGKPSLALTGQLSVAKAVGLAETKAKLAAISKPNYNPFATGVTHEELV